MKANSKRKVFGDAVDLLMGDMEEVTMPRGVQMLPVKSIQPFHDHPFHLYEGERLEDMIASVKEHGVLNPVIVQKLDTGYEMLSGHNRWNAAKLAGLKEIPAIVNLVRSDMPGLKIVLAHIEVFHHFPVYTDWYEAFSRIKWEIVVTATVVVVVVVVG